MRASVVSLLLLLPVVFFPSIGNAKPAGVLCSNRATGSLLVRVKCKRGEEALDRAALLTILAVQGPQGPAGEQGPPGVGGADGAAGPKGEPGAPATGPVPSGVTVRGIIGNRFEGTGTGLPPATERAYSSLPQPAPAPFTDLVVKANSVLSAACSEIGLLSPDCVGLGDFPDVPARQALCSGSFENPTAAPGVVCFYPAHARNIYGPTLSSLGSAGFVLNWYVPPTVSWLNTKESYLDGAWAYTAP